ncbi:MAG: aminotransferase class I/II-fold pyridoxal phosphate-dependent enzyme, partial [Candidatus Marinimicrobia bacterium]|nr:aminotransferase class I/II-fold pyridoxal phosphate-dependent enzyme [Candidatus Neomarinimicrobiota bacterium]
MKPNPWISNLAVYEPGKPMLELARQLGLESEAGIVKLASNENAWGPSPKAQAAMVAAAAQMHLYPDGSAYYLRRELARRNGLDIEQVVVGNGSNELLEFLAHVYLDHDTNIVMADRAFVVYALLARAYQADVIRVPMRDLTHDLDALLAAVTPKTRLVFVANPNNPTGTKVTPAAVSRFLQNLPEHVVAVFDEAYFEFLDPEDQPALLAELQGAAPRPNLYVLRTFSKAYGLAGLRLGYAFAAPESARLLQRVRQPF